jgi:epoxyqueuosine reductase
MGYLSRPDRVARRADPTLILPNARSLVMVTLDYYVSPAPELVHDPSRGRVSNYAWGVDYHSVALNLLEELADFLKRRAGKPIATRAYVDTGPILERSHARQAGLGFTGKNTMLIHPRRGSYFFLGEIITDYQLEGEGITAPMPGCGSCIRCLKACPTNAFSAPYILDARRCISYLTIEHKGSIPLGLRPLMANWVYGCDLCQEVCPWQRFAQPGPQEAFHPVGPDSIAPLLSDLLRLTDESFAKRYRGTALYRIKRERLVRNACVAAGNSGMPDLSGFLIPLLNDTSPLVRAHAAWALGQLGGQETALQSALEEEMTESVRAEIAWALQTRRGKTEMDKGHR